MTTICQDLTEQAPSAGGLRPAGAGDTAVLMPGLWNRRERIRELQNRSTDSGGADSPAVAAVDSAAGAGGAGGKSITPPASSNPSLSRTYCTEHLMILGIAKDGDQVSQHFGHCEGYRLYRIQNGEILEQMDVPNPGHEPGVLPRLLADNGVDVVIAGGMGPKASDLFCQLGMEVYVGVSGSLDDVAQQFIRGELQEGRNICHH